MTNKIDYSHITNCKSVSELCSIAVTDMQALKDAMSEDDTVSFNALDWHVVDYNEDGSTVCEMCVAGAVARGCGVPDDIVWCYTDADDSQSDIPIYNGSSQHLFNALDNMRYAILFPPDFYSFDDATVRRLEELEGSIEESLKSILYVVRGKIDSPESLLYTDIDYHIELFTRYQEYFESLGL